MNGHIVFITFLVVLFIVLLVTAPLVNDIINGAGEEKCSSHGMIFDEYETHGNIRTVECCKVVNDEIIECKEFVLV